jgi:methionyl aminopeptidase
VSRASRGQTLARGSLVREAADALATSVLHRNAYRYSSAELKAKEAALQSSPDETYSAIRRAAEVHRQVRAYARKTIRPGMTMTEIAELIEDGTRALVEENGLESGVGFPTGLSVNDCAAHYSTYPRTIVEAACSRCALATRDTTSWPASFDRRAFGLTVMLAAPNAGDKQVLQSGDILKVDFGVHVDGRIVDSAFTLTFEPSPYDELIKAVKEATNTGIRVRAPRRPVRLADPSADDLAIPSHHR